MSMTPIDLNVMDREGKVVIELIGELDISNAARVEQELREIEERNPPAVVLDLRRLQFLDSTGLRLIVAADARTRERGARLAVVPGPDRVHRVFTITFVDKRLDFVSDPGEEGAAQ
jgi:anti-sigma B factor antagonist